jgi:cbb3-type cytochrome oxidase subunit 3
MESANLAHWPAISLVIFFIFALGTLAWVYRTGSSETYSRLGQLALDDGETETTNGRAEIKAAGFEINDSRQTAGLKEVR